MNVNGISEWVGAILILSGALFSLLSAFGILRLPDVYTRAHATTKSATLGVLCTLLGTFLYIWLAEGIFSVRVLLGIGFVFLTAPVGGHLICRAARRANVKLAKQSVQDDLAEVFDQKLEQKQE